MGRRIRERDLDRPGGLDRAEPAMRGRDRRRDDDDGVLEALEGALDTVGDWMSALFGPVGSALRFASTVFREDWVPADPAAPDDGLTLDTFAEGFASGDGTRAEVDVLGVAADLGDVSVAASVATVRAGAASTEPGAFATGETYSEASGADIVLTFGGSASRTPEHASGSRSYYAERTVTVSIEIEAYDLADGPVELMLPRPVRGRGMRRRDLDEDGEAEASARGLAIGEATFAQTFTDTFATDGFALATAFVGLEIA